MMMMMTKRRTVMISGPSASSASPPPHLLLHITRVLTPNKDETPQSERTTLDGEKRIHPLEVERQFKKNSKKYFFFFLNSFFKKKFEGKNPIVLKPTRTKFQPPATFACLPPFSSFLFFNTI